MKKKQGMMEKISVCVAGSAWAFRTIFLKAPHIYCQVLCCRRFYPKIARSLNVVSCTIWLGYLPAVASFIGADKKANYICCQSSYFA